jgi:hypothetical protein
MGGGSDADVTMHITVIAVVLDDNENDDGGGGDGDINWKKKFFVLKTRLAVVLGGGKVNNDHILNLAVGLIALSAAYSDRLYSWHPGNREGGSTTASLEARRRRVNSLPHSGRH